MKNLGLFIFSLFISATVSLAQGMGPGMGPGPGNGGPGSDDDFFGYMGHEIEHNLVVPQVAVGPQVKTTLILLNFASPQQMSWASPGNLQVSGTVFFFKGDGTPLSVSVNSGQLVSQYDFSLNPPGLLKLELSASQGLTTGWALVKVDDDSADGSSWGMMDGQAPHRGQRLMATVLYTLMAGEQIQSQVGVIPSVYERGHFLNSIIPVQFRRDEKTGSVEVNTGVAMVNTGAEAASINLRLLDGTGQVAAERSLDPLELASGHQRALYVDQLFPGVLEGTFTGFMEVSTGSEGVVALGLLQSQGVLTSIPVHHYGVWTGSGMMSALSH